MHELKGVVDISVKSHLHTLTAWAPYGVKSKFMEELQENLDTVPQNDILLLLGDLNVNDFNNRNTIFLELSD